MQPIGNYIGIFFVQIRIVSFIENARTSCFKGILFLEFKTLNCFVISNMISNIINMSWASISFFYIRQRFDCCVSPIAFRWNEKISLLSIRDSLFYLKLFVSSSVLFSVLTLKEQRRDKAVSGCRDPYHWRLHIRNASWKLKLTFFEVLIH